MIAYKGFDIGLICRGYQFVMGRNTTTQANCRQNGFHCAENPLDCLHHYADHAHAEYYLVRAEGDLNEDQYDSKIACTELTILKKLDLKTLLLHGLAFMVDHPLRPWSSIVARDAARANNGYAVVRGIAPKASGDVGDILALAQEEPEGRKIDCISLFAIDGAMFLPGVWYDIDAAQKAGNAA